MVLHCTINFDLLCDRGQQGGVFKVMKNNHFLVFLGVWVFFHNFLGILKTQGQI